MKKKKLKKSDIFEELREKKQSPVIPIIVFLSIVTILCVIVILIFNAVMNNENISIPWIKEKNETTKHQTSSRDQMGLIIPKLPKEYNSVEMLESTLTYKRVTKDNNGYIITMELTTKAEFATIEVKEVLIDGFYVTTKFAISDTIDRDADGYELPEQIPTEYKFRIKQTELDELGIFGFNEIKIFYDIETNKEKYTDVTFAMVAINDLNIVNERKGIISIEKVNGVEISYYKTVDAEDATYIYFDLKNKNLEKDIMLYVKKLKINGEIYEYKDLKEKLYREAQHAVYIKIPKDKVSRVNTIDITFFLIEENIKGEIEAAYITNGYQRSF
jgi:hypothetical protein